MFVVGVLLPCLVLGAIAWGVIGVMRQRGREEFTLATATAFYARVMVVAGILALLAGAGVILKLGLSLIDPHIPIPFQRARTAIRRCMISSCKT